MLHKVLSSRETRARAPLAIFVRTHAPRLGPTMLLMDLALMSQQTTAIREPEDLLAATLFADIRPVMLVHVLRPFAFPRES